MLNLIKQSIPPNRYEFIHNAEDLIRFVDQLQQLGQKPVGFKIVVSKVSEIETLVRTMVELDKYPSFITIDGGEGGTGATFQELQDGVGLPLFTALPIVSGMLEKYGIRDKVKLAASGKLVTPDKIAIALGLGADFVNIARGMMISVGCIMSQPMSYEYMSCRCCNDRCEERKSIDCWRKAISCHKLCNKFA
ncbi:Ferredoxin-dependent glutamate synthase [Staphylococcus aureus]|uniref:Ferredoxin-dependent glutamate synthase n=1 Tax=Staphylococcus aureus TaxID=1280 RepID=A0A380DQG1_STAAU|nr:Ferredoxin-dependent glutamate synthase [Staphylococcus aureus]